MKVELRNVKVIKSLSEETPCFTANIWIDGRKAGDVRNHGTGGANEVWFADREVQMAFDAFVAAMPPIPNEWGGDPLPMDADMFVGRLLDEHEERAWATRQCRKRTLFRLKGDGTESWRTVEAPFTPAVKAFLVRKYGDAVETILNEQIGGAK